MLKKSFFIFFFLLLSTVRSQTPCINGMANEYPCNNFDLMSFIPIKTLANSNGTPTGSDVWGWTDPETNKEYAIAGMSNSTAFIDITDPINPVFLGRLDSNKGSSHWRDIKVFNNYAFIVADNVGEHGMQVFDLTKLRGATSEQNFNADFIYTGVGSCHNIVINETKGVAYLLGCREINGGGPIFIDITTPTTPSYIGDYRSEGYSHDAQVITYSGPDTIHRGKEIYIGSNENKIIILDVTDKTNIVKISSLNYPQIGYTHQGWFTDDHRYFILGDEKDEQNFGMNTRSLIFDLQDLENPKLSFTHFGKTKAIDHNGYVKNNEFFLSNYTAGMRVFDISNILSTSNPMVEIGYFDTYPQNDNTAFNGVWSIYPYFSSGSIIINDINRGLYIVKKSGTLDIDENKIDKINVKIFPNPTQKQLVISINKGKIKNLDIMSIIGKKIISRKDLNSSKIELDISNLSTGVYLVKVNTKTKKIILN